MIGKLSEKATRGILWLKNEMEAYTVSVEPKGVSGEITLNPVSAHVKLIPQIQNEKWKMLVKVNTEGAVVENGTNLNPFKSTGLKAAERSLSEKDIENRIEMAFLAYSAQEESGHLLGLGRRFLSEIS